MIHACNEEGVSALRAMAGHIDNAVDEIKNLTDSVRGVANDNRDALGPHVNSLDEALDDIKSCLERSSSPVSDIAVRLNRVADKYQDIIDDDPFADSSGGGMETSGVVGAAAGALGGAVAAGSAGVSSGGGMSAGGSDGSSQGGGSASSSSSGMEPIPGATPRNLSHTQYGFTMDSNFESVYDSPLEMDNYLYGQQGSAYADFQGTCGLCSIANILRLAGVLIGEGDAIEYAAPNGLCIYNGDPSASGGTSAAKRKQILEHFGIKSELVPVPLSGSSGASTQTIDAISNYVSEGRGVILSVHAGILDPAAYNSNGFGDDYHAVTVTSVKKDPYGNPIGFYICDSNQGTKYYTAEQVRSSLTGNSMNVTQQIIR